MLTTYFSPFYLTIVCLKGLVNKHKRQVLNRFLKVIKVYTISFFPKHRYNIAVNRYYLQSK